MKLPELEKTSKGEILKIFKDLRDKLKKEKSERKQQILRLNDLSEMKQKLDEDLVRIKKESKRLPKAVEKFKQKIQNDFGNVQITNENSDFEFLRSKIKNYVNTRIRENQKNELKNWDLRIEESRERILPILEKSIEFPGFRKDLEKEIILLSFSKSERQDQVQNVEEETNSDILYFLFLKIKTSPFVGFKVFSNSLKIDTESLLDLINYPAESMIFEKVDKNNSHFEEFLKNNFVRVNYEMVANLKEFCLKALVCLEKTISLAAAFKPLNLLSQNSENSQSEMSKIEDSIPKNNLENILNKNPIKTRITIWTLKYHDLENVFLPFWLREKIEIFNSKTIQKNALKQCKPILSKKDQIFLIKMGESKIILVICFANELDPIRKIHVGVYSIKNKIRLSQDSMDLQGLYCVVLDKVKSEIVTKDSVPWLKISQLEKKESVFEKILVQDRESLGLEILLRKKMISGFIDLPSTQGFISLLRNIIFSE